MSLSQETYVTPCVVCYAHSCVQNVTPTEVGQVYSQTVNQKEDMEDIVLCRSDKCEMSDIMSNGKCCE